jgi:hypothetical protein
MRRKKYVIKPGCGVDNLQLGQTQSKALSVLGKPDKIMNSLEGSYFYIYQNEGIDLDFGEVDGVLKIIFFYGEGGQGHRGADVETDQGLQIGDSFSKVLKVYGYPDKQGEPVKLSGKMLSGKWIYYESGIQFDFDDDNTVKIISVSLPLKN